MKNERWAFSESELADPAACNAYDELIAIVPDCELGIIVCRNGEVSNRWEDGAVGVPADVAEAANADESLYHPDLDTYADVWADVFVDADGAWLGWAKAAPEVRTTR